ncbi:NADH-quinone oxidoreductase subunit L [Risungbinella massiliensis]|uniref:NADH-quinone oxidoreductase subunit L n=1 Tax=Risungbinella massiliensis TaxID=1329796 RepID=UPI0005CC1C62|nr:NADH-quinone oxidoreductase subunit L [Risungbinella massiliensis]
MVVGILLFAPLLAFILLVIGRTYLKRNGSGSIAMLAVGCSFLLSTYLLIQGIGSDRPLTGAKHLWFQMGEHEVYLGYSLEPIQLMMLTMVSLISLVVQFYSMEYMKKDSRIAIYYAYLSLFTFSMLGLVLSSNLLQIYFFWELVGVSSFLLIGFWYFKEEAKRAAKKAFIVTRIGDVGLFIALGLVFSQIGSFELDVLYQAIDESTISPGVITLIAISLFIGAVGKSGQLPLHTWLPDAMEGPTPVSALIHAATMVAAGVYLVAFTFPVFEASTVALNVVAYVGGITAIFAAIVAIGQNDLKRILAYSTVSQLGYMMLALGSGSTVAGTFHLLTHAFFKALLFLGAGAIMLVYHHHQDIRKMGGLWKREKGLGVLFLTGCLAIAGIPPFSGFFSKDEILVSVYQSGHLVLFVIAVVGAMLTAFYMFRLFFTIFWGEEKRNVYQKVGAFTRVPLYFLATLSVLVGFLQFPTTHFTAFLQENEHVVTPIWIPILATGVSVLGIALAYFLYVRQPGKSAKLTAGLPMVRQFVRRAFYVNEMYQVAFVYPLKGLGWILTGLDRFGIGALAKGTTWFVQMIGKGGSKFQDGQVQRYLLVSLIGMVVLFLGLTVGRLLP